MILKIDHQDLPKSKPLKNFLKARFSHPLNGSGLLFSISYFFLIKLQHVEPPPPNAAVKIKVNICTKPAVITLRPKPPQFKAVQYPLKEDNTKMVPGEWVVGYVSIIREFRLCCLKL